MSYFVTGTDTGVGKTLLSCALLHAFAARGKRVAGFKPVAAGCDEDDRNGDAKRLRAASSIQATYGQVNPYCFVRPIAPHLAARHAGVRIDFSRILTSYRELAGQVDEVIVEGAGGFCVPLNEKQDSADLAKQLGLPVILVVGMRLGCLNHALLTLRAIADLQLECAGWIANVLDADMPALQENIEALRERVAAPLLGIVPFQSQPDACAAAANLNLDLLEKKQADG
ncbi:dethiobiotin synthase [Sideroxydans lithotrophicus]|uniref:ATP-dependent dethiobiotin synthetase BioD n=1 Tax=Sideroxydans lithotrophicus (strain ES-1) TaxID=580332 RepID=D5CNB3_SIDLE|nr:dethiobiotin synthase [Sideroxydans lithotrophicus]ADE12810.1 dethiobiotin synthase [Sideroxydans lithotrophicus ES-1]